MMVRARALPFSQGAGSKEGDMVDHDAAVLLGWWGAG